MTRKCFLFAALLTALPGLPGLCLGVTGDDFNQSPCGWLVEQLGEPTWYGSPDGVFGIDFILEALGEEAETFARTMDRRARILIGMEPQNVDGTIFRWRDLESNVSRRRKIAQALGTSTSTIPMSFRGIFSTTYASADGVAFPFIQTELVLRRVRELRYRIEMAKPRSQIHPLLFEDATSHVALVTSMPAEMQKVVAEAIPRILPKDTPVLAIASASPLTSAVFHLATVVRVRLVDGELLSPDGFLHFNADTIDYFGMFGPSRWANGTDTCDLGLMIGSALSYDRQEVNLDVSLALNFDEEWARNLLDRRIPESFTPKRSFLAHTIPVLGFLEFEQTNSRRPTDPELRQIYRLKLHDAALSLTRGIIQEFPDEPEIIPPSDASLNYQFVFTRRRDKKSLRVRFLE